MGSWFVTVENELNNIYGEPKKKCPQRNQIGKKSSADINLISCMKDFDKQFNALAFRYSLFRCKH